MSNKCCSGQGVNFRICMEFESGDSFAVVRTIRETIDALAGKTRRDVPVPFIQEAVGNVVSYRQLQGGITLQLDFDDLHLGEQVAFELYPERPGTPEPIKEVVFVRQSDIDNGSIRHGFLSTTVLPFAGEYVNIEAALVSRDPVLRSPQNRYFFEGPSATKVMDPPTVDGAIGNRIPYAVLQNGLAVHARYSDFHANEPVEFIISGGPGLPLRETTIVPPSHGDELIHGFNSDSVRHLAGHDITITFRLPSRQPDVPTSEPAHYFVESAR